MKRCDPLRYLAASVLLPTLLAPQGALAGGKADVADRLAGTWSLVSSVSHSGQGLRGIKTVHADGRFALIMTRPDRGPAAASVIRIEEEDATLPVGRTVEAAHGTLTLDPAGGAITFHFETSSFPNWEAVEQRRNFQLAGERWTYSLPLPPWGGTRELVWQRLQ